MAKYHNIQVKAAPRSHDTRIWVDGEEVTQDVALVTIQMLAGPMNVTLATVTMYGDKHAESVTVTGPLTALEGYALDVPVGDALK